MTKPLKLLTSPSSALFFAFILFSFILLHTAALQAAPNTSDNSQKKRAEALTQKLYALSQAYQQANLAAREQALSELQSVAAERYQLLLDLVDTDPSTVSRVALPNHARKGMPDAVMGYIEQRAQAQGELEVRYEDADNGEHKLHHVLNVDGKRVSLVFDASASHLLSGQQVSVNGLYLGFDSDRQQNEGIEGALVLNSGDEVLLMAGGSTTTQTTSVSSVETLPYTTGEQKTLVLVVRFPDSINQQPWTIEEVRSTVFGDVNAWYQENSFGNTWLTGDVYGYYSLPINATCDTSSISTYADAAATNDGVDISAYDRIVYVYPRVSMCSWGGQGTVGGLPSKTWVNGRMTPDLIAHEMGHNFGLYHSHHLNCDSVSIADNCSVNEYGDVYDVMGTLNFNHFNAFQKERLGWLSETTGDIVTINNSGSVYLEPYETAPGTYPKVLKISQDAAQDSWYYLEYRQAIGFDTDLESNANIINGLLFHNASPSDANSSMLLDMTPNSSSAFGDPALESGNSYTDANTGVTITTGLVDGSGAYADISYGQQSCVHSAPSVSFLTSESAWVSAGTAVDFSLTVTNNDSSVCSSSSFNLAANLPQGWTSTVSPSSLDLTPGGSATVTLTVTSAFDAANGFYDFVASASSSTSGTASDTATYVVENTSSNGSPVAVDDDVVLSSTSSVTINVLSNDYDPDQDQIVIDSITQGSKGDVTLNADNTLTYTPAKRFKDKDSFTYSIIDGEGGSAAASVLITLQASSGGGDTSTGGGGSNKGKGKPTK